MTFIEEKKSKKINCLICGANHFIRLKDAVSLMYIREPKRILCPYISAYISMVEQEIENLPTGEEINITGSRYFPSLQGKGSSEY